MSVSIRPRHQQQQQPQQHAQSPSRHGHLRPIAAVEGGEPALPPPPPLGPLGRPEPDLSRRRKSTQAKRSIITHVACQPCQRRKHKCDGQRPICTPCLARNRSDCAYDAAGDQRRTTALKTRIQDLSRQAEDLKTIVRGIAAAPDRDAAFATARLLAAEGFAQAADVANAFRLEQAHDETASEQRDWAGDTFLAAAAVEADPAASYSYPSASEAAMPNAAFQHNGAGDISFPPWPSQTQSESLGFIQSDYENTPFELSGPFWQSEHHANSDFHSMAPEVQENEKPAPIHSEHMDSDGELRQPGYDTVPEANSGVSQAFDTVRSAPYWYLHPSRP